MSAAGVRCSTLLGLIAVLASATARAQEPAPVSYVADVEPILRAHCMGCHQPAKAKGDVVLTTAAHLLAGQDGLDPMVVPGDPDGSLLIEVITPVDGDPPQMPEEGDALSDAEISVLRRWIEGGALDDSGDGTSRWATPDRPPEYARPPVVTDLAYSSDGALLAVAGRHEVVLHDVAAGSIASRLVGLAPRIESIAFSPDGTRLAVAGGAPGRFGEVQIWDVAKRELQLSKLVTEDCLFGVSWSPDGKTVAFGATDTAVRAIVAATGESVLYQAAHNDWVLDSVWSTDASHLVTVSRDRSMKLILVESQQFIDNITSITPGALRGGLMAVDRHPTKDELLAAGSDGQPKLYRMYREKQRKIGDDYNLIRAFEALGGRVRAAEFSADGTRIVAGTSRGHGGAVRAYRTEDGATLWTRELPTAVFAATFRPDGKLVAATGFDGVIRLLDAESGEVRREFDAVPMGGAATIEASADQRGEDR